MTSKAAWASSLKGFKKATSKKGRVPAPIKIDDSIDNFTADNVVKDSHQTNESQLALLKAVISSQKATIAAFQEDLAYSYGKIAKTKAELKKCKAKIAEQSDYKKLKDACDGGYALGFDAGQIKVQLSLLFDFSSGIILTGI